VAEHVSSRKIYWRLLKYIVPYWWAFALGIVGSILFSGADTYVTAFTKPLLDEGFSARNPAFLKTVPFVIMGIFIVRGIASFVASYFMARVGRDIVRTLRNQMFERLLKLPAAFFDLSTSGQLLSKIIYNVDQVASACTNAVTTTVQSVALIIGLFGVMFWINWKLTLLYLAAAPLVAYLIRVTGKRMRRLSGKAQDHLGDITHISEEAIEGYKVVRIFGGQKYECDKFQAVNYANRNQSLKIVTTQSLSTMTVLFIGAVILALTVWLVTTSSVHLFGLTAGGFTAMIGAMLAIFKPMRDFASVNNIIQQGVAGAQSVFELLDTPIEKDHGTKILQNVRGEVEYRNVTFQYRANLGIALNNINFKQEAGKMIALVGRSGSGKSTLVSLLPRFYDVAQGQILIDGQDIHDVTLESLRANVAIVSQHVTLFNDTIAHNIAYGSLETVSPADIENAARAAHAMEFIEKFPEGLETVVGENGVLLSGGQRQRLAIARAILKNSPILILDEATSALDTESERKIQEALERLMKNRTTLVIAHRLSTIEHADVIIVMDQGQIVEMGRHHELLTQQGAYAELYHLQFKDYDRKRE
jgi:subfamily B ATP-binding cassette protein MsbA